MTLGAFAFASVVALAATPGHALSFDFSFINEVGFGFTPGTVTGHIDGLYQAAETLTHARMLRVGARLPYPLGPPDVFAMAVSVVARAA